MKDKIQQIEDIISWQLRNISDEDVINDKYEITGINISSDD